MLFDWGAHHFCFLSNNQILFFEFFGLRWNCRQVFDEDGRTAFSLNLGERGLVKNGLGHLDSSLESGVLLMGSVEFLIEGCIGDQLVLMKVGAG